MNVKSIEEPNYSLISTHFLAGVAEQGLPMDYDDLDAVRVNEALFAQTDQPSFEEIYVA